MNGEAEGAMQGESQAWQRFLSVVDVLWVLALIAGFLAYAYMGVMTTWIKIVLAAGLVLFATFVVGRASALKEVLLSRSTRYGTNFAILVAAVVGILALANFVARNHHHRFDLTKGGVFTLSDQTQKVLDSLGGEVKAIAFFGENNPRRQEAENMMKEYGYLSKKFSHEMVDPELRPERAQQFAIKTDGTVVLTMDSKKELVTRLEEQDLTAAMIKLTRSTVPKVYMVTGHGERAIGEFGQKGLSKAKEQFEKENLKVEELVLARAEAGVPTDAALVVVPGPATTFFDTEIEALQKYLDQGGRALLLLDPPPAYGMDSLVQKWGVELGNDVVVDVSPVGRLFGFGPAAPLANQYDYHEITKDFRVMTFYPLARSVRKASTPPTGVTITELIKTSPNAWAETDLESLSANQEVRYDEGADRLGPVSLGAAVSKKAADEKGSGEPEKPAGEASAEGSKGKETRLVIIGDSDFASNGFLEQQGNSDLLLNAINWLAGEEDLISIRPKEKEDPRLVLTQNQMRNVFWFTFILVPIGVMGLGVTVWVRRR